MRVYRYLNSLMVEKMNKISKFIAAILPLLLASLWSSAQISTTKHNLSSSGPGTVKATSETEICKFCHTPHNASSNVPLWNHTTSTAVYTLYSSSTMNATVGQPDGSSILCLSCHDGTVALGSVVNPSSTISFGSITTMPAGKTNLGTNLSDDHPISFVYNSALAIADGQLKDTSALIRPVSLDKNGKMQCTSCHDAHDNTNGKFLVQTTQGSALCFSCHNRTYWSTSLHNTSTKTWNGVGTNPWQHTTYANVADNACENCHQPHTAGGGARILNYQNEEDNCLNCHNGNVDTKNVATQFSKFYKHNVYGYTGVHDPTEAASLPTSLKHVECVDCHNPHAANSSAATAPAVNGTSIGVMGVNSTGSPVAAASNQYEICFRCHADNSVFPNYITRWRGVGNRRLDFSISNVSYHPVEAAGQNTSMTSLLSPLTVSSVIYCTDCHASDGSGSPAGPHGSNNIAILKYAYDTTKFPMMGSSWTSSDLMARWPLCFQCHNVSAVSTIHSGNSGHFLKYVGCSTCHDPHGYDGTPAPAGGGGVSSAFTKLLNFDTSVVKPNPADGKLIDVAGRKCFMTCHLNGSVADHAHSGSTW